MSPPDLDYALIDCHHHVRINDVFGTSLGSGGYEGRMERDLSERLAMMDRNGIERAVLMPSFDYDKSDGLKSTELALDLVRRYQQGAADRFPWVFCSVEPQFYERGVKQLDQFLASHVFSGVTWHNRYHGVPADAPIMFDLVEVAVGHDAPIFLHAAGNLDHEEAHKVAKLVRAFPGGRFVLLDVMLSISAVQILTDVLLEQQRVWLDIANALPVMRVIEMVGRSVGWDRVLFGSCFYNRSHSNELCGPLEEFLVSDVDDADRKKVLHENVLNVLGDA